MTTLGNIEDIERALRAPATSFRELLLAGAAFVLAANALDECHLSNDTPLREHLTVPQPTVGDLRRLRDALVAAGWKPDEAF